MAGEGQILRAAREEKGWTLMDAEEVTKIRTRYLQALEEEDYVVLPGTAYAKGFLRTYAKQLGLNSEVVVGLYKANPGSMDESVLQAPLTPLKTRPFWLRPAIALLMSALAIALVIGISHFTQKPGETVRSEYSPPPMPEAPKEPQQANTATPSTPDPATGASSAADNGASTVTSDVLTAKLVFTEKCWVSLRVDGQAPLEQNFLAGTTKEITAHQKIEFLVVGNAGGVSITLNGKPYPSLGASGQVKNNIVLDKESLKTL
ncbi:MAG: DUF4115 domain-containing protein [Desulfitobacteriaceae bacterium]|nr:DUF4115 domain-containing protein [Desulfitobacteriaceae bacterium]MDI6879448.1 DUF4115 domain-containing protein [Desulfitobacteriaceae bacterium]MDI6915027.1 DUF4115 domain-containing protein [Desulfitobacteriaceae bacterium]